MLSLSKEEILMYAEKLKDETHKYIIKNVYGNNKTREEIAQDLGITPSLVTRRQNKAYKIMLKMKLISNEAWWKQYYLSCYDDEGYLSFDKIAELNNINKDDLRNCFEEYINSFTEEERITAIGYGISLEALKLANIQVLQTRVKGFSNYLNEFYAKNVWTRLKGEDIEKRNGHIFQKEDKKTDEVLRMDEQFLGCLHSIYHNYLDRENINEQSRRI